MEYYGSNYFRNANSGYENSTPYASDYHDCYPNYVFEAPKFVTCNESSSDYDAYYHLNQSRSEMAFSVSSVSQPEFVEFDLDNPHGGNGYYQSKTNFVISYSTFNEDDDVEYDPTPYGGGYDIAQTYGKPLPPSDKICYPKSEISNSPVAVAPLALPNVNEISDPIDSKEAKEPQENEVHSTTEEEEEDDDDGETDDEDTYDQGYSDNEEADNNVETEASSMPLALPRGQENEATFSDEEYPLTDYEFQNGNGYENENQFGQVETPGDHSSSDAMGFVESLFGWPCLSRTQQQEVVRDEYSNCNQWDRTADYFFGRSNVYGYGMEEEGRHARTIYGYERHYPEEAELKQVQYSNEASWLQEFNGDHR